MRLTLTWASQLLSGALVVSTAALVAFSVGAPLEGEFTCSGRPAATEIFEGITYGCKQMEPSAEASGVVHWVRINLTARGIVPYFTSEDPTAVSEGWQYRLRRVRDVVATEHLAVAINGTLFSSKSSWWRRKSGDLANTAEPVVADHIVSQGWLDTYLLWFDDQMIPHLGPNKTTEAELAMAKWGIGGEDSWLRDGRVWSDHPRCHIPDGRTAVAVDLPRKLLFLAVGAHISPTLMYQTLADLGAKDGMLLDGGDSSSMPLAQALRQFHPGPCTVGDRLQTNSELEPSVCGKDVARPAISAKLLTKDEARSIAVNIAKLPQPRPGSVMHSVTSVTKSRVS
jgi:Phosphodiester glycosidase